MARGTVRRSALLLSVVGLLVGPWASGSLAGSGAGAPSERGVQPVVSDTGNSNPLNECRTLTGQNDVHAFQIAGEGGGFPGGSPYDDGTLTVTISDWHPQAKTFDWDTNIPVLGVWVKGGSGGEGNWYDYSGFSDQPPAAGADNDGDLHPKDNPSGGPAGLSHVTFCYGDAETPPDTPDIEVAKSSDASGPVQPGDSITYTIVVANVGGGTAHDIVVSDELPDGVGSVDGIPSLSGAEGFCTATGSTGPGGEEHYAVRCELDQLAAGDEATITVTVTLQGDAPCGDLVNRVHAEADDEPGGAVDDGNDDQVTDDVACACDVEIAKSVDPTSGNPGDDVTYTYVVRNTGTAGLTDLVVTDDVLGQIGQIASLAPGAHETLHADATLPSEGATVVNVGTVTAETQEGERCRASDDAIVTIVSGGGGGDNPPGDNPPGEGPGGTAFTGPADLPIAAALLLLLIGLVALGAARTGTPPTEPR